MPAPNQQEITASSPTAFLDMLSRAATDHVGESTEIPVLRNGAEHTMMSGLWASTPGPDVSTGLTPFLSFSDNQQAQLASDRPNVDRQESGTSSHLDGNIDNSRRSSQQGSTDSPMYLGKNTSVPGGLSNFSPSGILSFPPSPADPKTCGMGWREADPDAGKPVGTWRDVETTSNIFNPNDFSKSAGLGNPVNAPFSADDDTQGMDAATQQQLLLDLFWPGWPPNLPQPHVVNELVDSFFNLVPNMPRLLNRARLLARLALPPTHSNFPHPALLHAICASASAWCDPKVYMDPISTEYSGMMPGAGIHAQGHYFANMNKWQGQVNDGANTSFATQQAFYGKEAVQEGLNTGNRLFDVVRAMIIFSRVFIDDTRWVVPHESGSEAKSEYRMLECWAYSGLVARMILPLGLNVRSAELSLKSVMLPPPADALEREERRITVWMAFYHDTVSDFKRWTGE